MNSLGSVRSIFSSKWLIVLVAIVFIISYVGLEMSSAEEATGNDNEETNENEEAAEDEETAENEEATEDEEAITEDEEVDEEIDEAEPTIQVFPADEDFRQVAETDVLILKVHRDTGHFIVEDKRTDHVYRSFPDPEHWVEGQHTDFWQNNLKSPVIIAYVRPESRGGQRRDTNFLSQNGEIVNYEETEDGFRLMFHMASLGIGIPVEVRIEDDFLETRIIDDELIDGDTETERQRMEAELLEALDVDDYYMIFSMDLTDEQKALVDAYNANLPALNKLVHARIYPFLNAAQSRGQSGYVVVPDGSGALINFRESRPGNTSYYNERIYGSDWVYSHTVGTSSRKDVRMPIFGLKSGDKAILGVVHEGDEYANILGAPSGSQSQYNWSTAQFVYRDLFFQMTRRDGSQGFNTFSEERYGQDRVIRYFFMEEGEDNYVGLAKRYRQYLMEEFNIDPIENDGSDIPLHVSILGGDTEEGFFFNSYVPLTTTSQATDIIRHLRSLGIEQMSVRYLGWQRKGLSSYGGHFPVDRRIGGNDGMKEFIDYAAGLDIPVYFDGTSYAYNNNSRKDGFNRRRDGLRDPGGQIVEYVDYITGDRTTLVSPVFMSGTVEKDLPDFAKLGVSGISFGDGIGSYLNSDLNDRMLLARHEARQLQEDILRMTRAELGSVHVEDGNFYVLPYVSHLHNMYSDYSYDIFTDEVIPFAQIAVHGLVTYTFNYRNLDDEYVAGLLRAVEYGALPAFILTDVHSQDLVQTMSARSLFSTHYADWAEEIAEVYQRVNAALKDVQGEFIVEHRTLDRNVKETIYSNGQRIIVNYNPFVYTTADGMTIEENNFVVVRGGDQ